MKMKTKISKYMICENPLVDDARVFILHCRKPVIIAEAFHLEPDQEAEAMEMKKQFTVGASVDYPGEYIILGAIFIEPVESNDPQNTADDLAKIMSRMGDWYHSYLKWEDEQ